MLTHRLLLFLALLCLLYHPPAQASEHLHRLAITACNMLLWTQQKAPPTYLWDADIRKLSWYRSGHDTYTARGATAIGEVEVLSTPNRFLVEIKEVRDAYPLKHQDISKAHLSFQPLAIEILPETDPVKRLYTKRRIRFTLENNGNKPKEFKSRVNEFMRFMFETLPQQKNQITLNVTAQVDERIL